MSDHKILTTRAELEAYLKEARDAKALAADTETTGLDHKARLVGIAMCTAVGSPVYVPVGHGRTNLFDQTVNENVPHKDIEWFLGELFGSEGLRIVFHNAKFDMRILAGYGVDLHTFGAAVHCTHILAWLLEPERKGGNGLDALLRRYFSVRKKEKPWNPQFQSGASVSVEAMAEYACGDVKHLLSLFKTLGSEISANPPLRDMYLKYEVPSIRLVADMERYGAYIDRQGVFEARPLFEKAMGDTQIALADLLNIPVTMCRINSAQWISKALVDERGLWSLEGEEFMGEPLVRSARARTWTTKAGVLEKVSRGEYSATDDGAKAAQLILRWRAYEKIVSTFIPALEKADPKDNRIHPSWNNTGTGTGRYSCDHPNMQNLPSTVQEGLPGIREFVTAPEGRTLVVSDYSQLEYRFIAEISQEPLLLDTYLHGANNGDMHEATRVGIEKRLNREFTRKNAKTINFGEAYGMGAKKMAAQFGCTEDEAREMLQAKKDAMPAVYKAKHATINECRKTGKVTTYLGRHRHFPHINSDDRGKRAYSERAAWNARIQGSAADLVRAATCRMYEEFVERGWYRDDRARILIQVHDEIVVECDEGLTDEVTSVMKDVMENTVTASIPFVAEPSSAKTWAEAK